jgi:hypothetical protein
MVKMIYGRIACKISQAPSYVSWKYYCDFCGKYFNDRDSPPCDEHSISLDSLDDGDPSRAIRNSKVPHVP